MTRAQLSQWMSSYGMLAVLIVLCVYFALATLREQQPRGREAGEQVAAKLAESNLTRVIVVSKEGSEGDAFAAAVAEHAGDGYQLITSIQGDPRDLRRGLETLAESGARIDAVATTGSIARWKLVEHVHREFPALGRPEIVVADSYLGSDFLNPSNLRTVLTQIVAIAISAVGMTMVVITAGIDLSVGSLIALSAVVAAALVRELGGESAGVFELVIACLGAVGLTGLLGLISGLLVARFRMPPFIATLGMMQIASGLAYMIAAGQTIRELPASFAWLGLGNTFVLVPNPVVLMLVIYVAGHLFMSRTTIGRYIYAIGGNRQAAYLSGLAVGRILLFVYCLSGITAGIGGVVMASRLQAASPNYGIMYELFVITAVVVGGTSLAGGEGRIFGTLVGALIIAVIQNGMNLTGVGPYPQKIVLGGIILGAILLDQFRRHGWRLLLTPSR
jgi:ribose transport system permease protein